MDTKPSNGWDFNIYATESLKMPLPRDVLIIKREEMCGFCLMLPCTPHVHHIASVYLKLCRFSFTVIITSKVTCMRNASTDI